MEKHALKTNYKLNKLEAFVKKIIFKYGDWIELSINEDHPKDIFQFMQNLDSSRQNNTKSKLKI